ncbi:MAG: nitroreductase family protein [Candidatus Omnitrophota bacterium]
MPAFSDIFLKRRSIRKFRKAKLSKKFLLQIVRAASLAPTARNVQPWEFIVVLDQSRLQELSKIVSPNGTFLESASGCLIIFCRDTRYYLEDGCAATTQALLALSMAGWGACWIAGDKKDYAESVKTFCGIGCGFKLVSLIAIGKSAERPKPYKRELDKLIHWERFS